MVRHSNRLCLAGSPILATIGQFATALTWPMKLPPRRVGAILATTNQFATALMWTMDLPPRAAVSAYPPAVALRDRPSPWKPSHSSSRMVTAGTRPAGPKQRRHFVVRFRLPKSVESSCGEAGSRRLHAVAAKLSDGGVSGPGIEYQPRTVAGGHLLRRHRVEA